MRFHNRQIMSKTVLGLVLCMWIALQSAVMAVNVHEHCPHNSVLYLGDSGQIISPTGSPPIQGLYLDVLTPLAQLSDPVSLLVIRSLSFPSPGWGLAKEMTINDKSIFIDLLPVEPPPNHLFPQVVTDLCSPIAIEELMVGHYTVEVKWHSPWESGGVETATASFTVVPEPTTLGLIATALATAVFVRRRTASRFR
jgi:hypothetical protein